MWLLLNSFSSLHYLRIKKKTVLFGASECLVHCILYERFCDCYVRRRGHDSILVIQNHFVCDFCMVWMKACGHHFVNRGFRCFWETITRILVEIILITLRTCISSNFVKPSRRNERQLAIGAIYVCNVSGKAFRSSSSVHVISAQVLILSWLFVTPNFQQK